MSYDKENIFAKILKGEIPCDKVFENEYVFSFKDISPKAKTHILIIPKKSLIDISDFLQNADSLYQNNCLLYTSPSPRDRTRSRMPSSA